MPMSSYMRIRADIRGGFLDMTRSAEKPRTPPTSTAPSKNMSACCLERCTALSLVGQDETKGVVARLLRRPLDRGGFDRRTGDRRRSEQLLIRRRCVRLVRAEHRDACSDDEDRGGDERGLQPAIELRPPPQL